MVAIEPESHSVIQQWSPGSHVQLALHHAGKAIVRGPAIEEVAVGHQSLRKCADEPGREPGFSECDVRSMHLMAAVPAVLLAFASHTIDEGFLGGVVERVDACIHEAL